MVGKICGGVVGKGGGRGNLVAGLGRGGRGGSSNRGDRGGEVGWAR